MSCLFTFTFILSSKLKHLKLISLAKQIQLIYRFRDILSKDFMKTFHAFWLCDKEEKYHQQHDT